MFRNFWNCAKSVLPTLETAQRVSYWHWELRKERLTDVGTSANTLAALQREWESSVKPLRKTTDKNANYPYGVMNFRSHVGNLFPNSQNLCEMAL